MHYSIDFSLFQWEVDSWNPYFLLNTPTSTSYWVSKMILEFSELLSANRMSQSWTIINWMNNVMEIGLLCSQSQSTSNYVIEWQLKFLKTLKKFGIFDTDRSGNVQRLQSISDSMLADWDITSITSTTKQLINSRSENRKPLIKPMNDKWLLIQLMKCSGLSEARSNLLEILEIKFIPTHEVKYSLKLFKWGKFCEMSWTAVGRNPFNDQSRLLIQTLLKLEKCSGPSCEYSFETDVD